MKKLITPSALLLLLILATTSCHKESFITSPDANVFVSKDSVKFDTVFTATGSVTQSFKIINKNSQRLRLSSIKLSGGAASAFKININGTASSQMSDVEIADNDSIYIFVSVSVNPSTNALPFLVRDSILVQYNNKQRWIQLEAYGQNAHYLRNTTILSSSTWINDLPYVIIGGVRVAPNVTLNINAGVKIYAHANASIVVDGSLIANGTVDNKIIFTGDRLDEPYKYFPASWGGLVFNAGSKNNQIQFAEIKNAYNAISVLGPSLLSSPVLVMQQSVIDNALHAGIFCRNTNVDVSNSLISNSANNIMIESGGSYRFTHCTAASYSNNLMAHKTPVVSVSNVSDQSGSTSSYNLLAMFSNCIFWGETGFVDDEFAVNKQGNTPFAVTLSHCLYRQTNDPASITTTAVIKNLDPLFDSIDVSNRFFDFRQNNNTNAPGIDRGMTTTLLKDLDNKPRAVGLPDLGCYEKQ